MSTNEELFKNITILSEREHAKASERYVDVIFVYPQADQKWEGSVPIEYRRTGVSATTEEEKRELIVNAYNAMFPDMRPIWLEEQRKFWDVEKSNAGVTREFFDALTTFQWTCQRCQLPQNPNWARRTQDIKEFGYTLSTDTRRHCPNCNSKTTHLILLSLPRQGGIGYDIWSSALRSRILSILANWDSFEQRHGRGNELLPDHKFPEIRWMPDSSVKLPDDMSANSIRQTFQLINNQRNQQKREVCRNCFQTGIRGKLYGIPFFYKGTELWPKEVPQTGTEAEKGCIGCGWYDMEAWHEKLRAKLGLG